MKIKDSVIAEIKDRMDIHEIVSDFVTLKRKGQYYWACCPFHNEKTPSFSVTPGKGIYKCFGCGKAGDSISFVQDVEALNYLEALRYLANKYGITVEEEEMTSEEIKAHSERESLLVVLNYANEYFHKTLLETEEGKSIGLSYFRERGYGLDIIEKFQLGFSLEKWDAFHKAALEQSFEEEWLVKAGLVLKKEERVYDRFRGRVIFPIHNLSGKTIAFGARILKKNEKQPKYINSPETEVYHKGKILYGIHQAKKTIRDLDECFIVEGYTDVISLHLSGVENVVSSSGTALSDDQIRLIKRFTQNITVLFDGDKAGIKAAIRGIDMILEQGLNVRTVLFPEGEDPDSYSKKLGTTAFQEFLKTNRKDFIEFKIDLYEEETRNDPVKRADMVNEILDTVSKVQDAVLRSIYLKNMASKLGMEEQVLITGLNKLTLKSRKQQDRNVQDIKVEDILPVQEESDAVSIEDSIGILVRGILRLLLIYGENSLEEEGDGGKIHEFIRSEMEDIPVEDELNKRIWNLYLSEMDKGTLVTIDTLIQGDDQELKILAIDMHSSRYSVSPNWWDKFKIVVPKESDVLNSTIMTTFMRLKLKIIQLLIKKNFDNLTAINASDDVDQQIKLMTLHSKLKTREKEAATFLGTVVNY